MLKLAARFGVSSSYLARICTLLNVPRPDRGYWAKLAVRKAPHKPSLPAALPGDDTAWTLGVMPRVAEAAPQEGAPLTRLRAARGKSARTAASRRRTEEKRKAAAAAQASSDELRAFAAAWDEQRRLSDFFEQVEQRIRTLDAQEQSVLLERTRLAKALIGATDPLAQLLEWQTPEERLSR